MLSKCANPSCRASFRYLHEGKLFRIELASERKYEHFWLCPDCCRTMTLAVDGNVVVTRRLRPVTRSAVPQQEIQAA
jgi:hypothetical protein